ncbi:MAG TPA: cytochrome c oxidase assembly protein [Gemmatimonadales bacterium]|nr:cytochrome c oxidase assembly protein [Gemmatimonadales bacterium]
MLDIQWWCSARGTTWTWAWQAFPGVWIFVIALVIGLERAVRRSAQRPPRWRTLLRWFSVLLLWGTLDWPVGPLGAGYLMWVHSAQFLVLAMVAPPLLLLGLGPEGARSVLANRVTGPIIRAGTRPLLAMIVFTAVMVISHLPGVVDGLMKQQLGAFALDLSWFVSGLFFWWPVVLPEPPRPRFMPLVQMVYLFFGTQPHVYIAMWLLLGEFPKYATYELAPRMSGLSPLQDQAIGGGLMLLVTLPLVFAVLTVIYARWVRKDGA